MGQKTHPEGFRLGITTPHLSKWYAKKALYSRFLEEDFFLRAKIHSTFEQYLSISRIKIERILKDTENASKLKSGELIHITIVALFPRRKAMAREIRTYFETPIEISKDIVLANPLPFERRIKFSANLILKERVKKLLTFFAKGSEKTYTLSVIYIKNPFEDSVLIAKYIGEQLKRRIPFRRVMKQTVDKVMANREVKGVRIFLGGRLGGAEMARSEDLKKGRVPLQTFRADIDFAKYEANMTYGNIGIKIWILIVDICIRRRNSICRNYLIIIIIIIIICLHFVHIWIIWNL